MTTFDVAWQRIVALQGETFRQKTGRPFRYQVSGAAVIPSTTSRSLPRSHFARAFDRAPLRGPGQLQDLQGPSYLFAILTDARVTAGEPVAAPADVTRPASRPADVSPAVSRPPGVTGSMAAGRPEPAGRLAPASWLRELDPRRVLLVIPCSAAKAGGGAPPQAGHGGAGCPEALRAARARVLSRAAVDPSGQLPAWQRYQGGFYRAAGPALREAAATGHVVIISGGYGVAGAREPIGWYDRELRLGDWPPGLLEATLLAQARQAGTDAVVAFASQTSGYARLLRRTPWRQDGLQACLVTITGVTSGAMAKVPRRLGLAFTAFWNQQHDRYPPGTIANPLS